MTGPSVNRGDSNRLPAAAMDTGGELLCAWCLEPAAEGSQSLCLAPSAPETEAADEYCGHRGDLLASEDHSLCEDEGIPWGHPFVEELAGAYAGRPMVNDDHESCVDHGFLIPEEMADAAPPCPHPEICPAAHRSCWELNRPAEDCPYPECCPYEEQGPR